MYPIWQYMIYYSLLFNPPCLVVRPGRISFYRKQTLPLWNTVGIIILYNMNSCPFYKMHSPIQACQNKKSYKSRLGSIKMLCLELIPEYHFQQTVFITLVIRTSTGPDWSPLLEIQTIACQNLWHGHSSNPLFPSWCFYEMILILCRFMF